MKLFSSTLELRTIKTICSDGKKSGYLLGKVDSDNFHTEASSEAFRRITAIVKRDGKIPSYEILCEDPTLSDSTKNKLRDFGKAGFIKKDINNAIKKLKDYKSLRDLLKLSENIIEKLTNESVDYDQVINDISDEIAKVRSGSKETQVYRFGVGNNTSELLNKLIDGEGVKLIPSTFEAWDKENGGIPVTACVLIGANTGGGKSISASAMCKNLAERGWNPGVFSLEMSSEEVAARLVSAVSKVPVHKVIRGKKGLTEKEREHIRKTFSKWINQVKKNGGSYHLFDVDGSVSLNQALYTAKAYNVDVILIDYVALLEGVGGDDDWKKLSETVRAGKRFARANKIPVIFLAQLDNALELRYSKRMKDDADIAFFWNGDEEAKESGIIHIVTPKARNMKPINFDMLMEWEYTYMRDLTEEELNNMSKEVDEDNSGEGHKKKKKVLRDLTSSSSMDI